MTEYRFTLEAAGPDCSDDDFSEWVASRTGASGHVTRNGHHYIHFTKPASSLDRAVKDAVHSLTGWSGLRVVGFSSPTAQSNTSAATTDTLADRRRATARRRVSRRLETLIAQAS